MAEIARPSDISRTVPTNITVAPAAKPEPTLSQPASTRASSKSGDHSDSNSTAINGSVPATCERGCPAFLAYGSVLDNISGDATTMEAPRVVAKGTELFAERIKDIAKANGVPVVENAVVARALFKVVDIDQEIPPDLYQAVAEILMFAWRLKGTRPPTGDPGTGPGQTDEIQSV